MNMYSFIFTCNFIYIWFCCVSRYFSGFFFSFVLVVLCISVGRKLGREITSHLTCTQQAKSLLLFIIVSLSAACDSHTHTHDARRRTWCWQWWRWQQCRRRRQFRCCSCCGSPDFMSVLYICYKTQHDMSWHSHSAYILVASARLDPNNKAHTHTHSAPPSTLRRMPFIAFIFFTRFCYFIHSFSFGFLSTRRVRAPSKECVW